jgi:exopolysaccharide production protein ExoQ
MTGLAHRRSTGTARGSRSMASDEGGRLEELVAVIGVMLFSGAFVPLIQQIMGVAPDVGEGDRFTQALLAPLYLAALLALIWRRRRPSALIVALGHPLTWYLVGWALLSASWSDEPATTVRRSVALAASVVFALFFVTRFSYERMLRLLGRALSIIVVLSILFAVAGYGISGGIHEGAWRGVFADKNGLGRAMVLTAFTLAALAIAARGRERVRHWSVAAAACALVLLSRSATSLLVLAAMALLFGICVGLRGRRSRFLAVSFAGVLCSGGAVLLAMAQDQALLDTLGKDITFTGRTSLWAAALAQIAARPLIGYGFGGFWTGWGGPAAIIWEQVGWTPPHAHNGLIDLGLELGLVGVLLFCVGFGATMLRAFSRIRPHAETTEIWPVLYLCFLLLSNLTESALVRQNNGFWVLYCVTGFALARLAREAHVTTNAVEVRTADSPGSNAADQHAGSSEDRLSPGVRRRLRSRAVRGSAGSGERGA